jgi:CsoR family transcriptional regulator, copper-sensing transcriptional repressor
VRDRAARDATAVAIRIRQSGGNAVGSTRSRCLAEMNARRARGLLSAQMPLGGIGTRALIMMNDATKQRVLARIHRIAGQLEGVARMIEEDRYCVDVLLQIVSAQAALGQAGKVVLRSHVETCMSDAMATGKPAERRRKVDELMEVFARYGCLGKRSLG